MLRRILRLRRFLSLVERRDAVSDLAALAFASGYADQQHLARDTRAIARATPSQLVEDRAMSDSSTTRSPQLGTLL